MGPRAAFIAMALLVAGCLGDPERPACRFPQEVAPDCSYGFHGVEAGGRSAESWNHSTAEAAWREVGGTISDASERFVRGTMPDGTAFSSQPYKHGGAWVHARVDMDPVAGLTQSEVGTFAADACREEGAHLDPLVDRFLAAAGWSWEVREACHGIMSVA